MACVECQPLWWGLQITVMLQTCNSLTHWFWPRVASPPPKDHLVQGAAQRKKPRRVCGFKKRSSSAIWKDWPSFVSFVQFCSVLLRFVGIFWELPIRNGARCMGPPPPSLPFHKIAAGGTANALAAWKMPGRPTSGVSMLSYRHPPICQFCFSVWCLVFVP